MNVENKELIDKLQSLLGNFPVELTYNPEAKNFFGCCHIAGNIINNFYISVNGNDCKISFKENLINEYFNQFINELVEYDSVVNQFFLPMIKQKFDEPKEQLEKEIKNQKAKLERITTAYINGD